MHHHHHAAHAADSAHAAANATANGTAVEEPGTEAEIMAKMKAIEQKIDAKEAEAAAAGVAQGRLIVNGPLPSDFAKVFADAVAAATGCDANVVKIVDTHGVESFIQLAVTTKSGEVE